MTHFTDVQNKLVSAIPVYMGLPAPVHIESNKCVIASASGQFQIHGIIRSPIELSGWLVSVANVCTKKAGFFYISFVAHCIWDTMS